MFRPVRSGSVRNHRSERRRIMRTKKASRRDAETQRKPQEPFRVLSLVHALLISSVALSSLVAFGLPFFGGYTRRCAAGPGRLINIKLFQLLAFFSEVRTHLDVLCTVEVDIAL